MSIRPAYRHGRFAGFCLWTTGPIGRVYRAYKHAVLALASLS